MVIALVVMYFVDDFRRIFLTHDKCFLLGAFSRRSLQILKNAHRTLGSNFGPTLSRGGVVPLGPPGYLVGSFPTHIDYFDIFFLYIATYSCSYLYTIFSQPMPTASTILVLHCYLIVLYCLCYLTLPGIA